MSSSSAKSGSYSSEEELLRSSDSKAKLVEVGDEAAMRVSVELMSKHKSPDTRAARNARYTAAVR